MICDEWIPIVDSFMYTKPSRIDCISFGQLVDFDFSDEEIYLVGIWVFVWINNWYCFPCDSTFAPHRIEWNCAILFTFVAFAVVFVFDSKSIPVYHTGCMDGVRLSVIYPISWLHEISDRTRAQINEYKYTIARRCAILFGSQWGWIFVIGIC